MSREAMKLALEALEEIALAGMSVAPEMIDSKEAFHARQAWRFIGIAARAMEPVKKALAEKPAQQEPVSDRENAIIRFALHQFMSNAYSNMNAAAQDKDSRHYTVGAVEKFAKDAKDAEALLSRLQFKAPQPAQRKPWVGLTDVEIASACKKHGGAEWWWRDIEEYGRAIEAKLREKNA